MGLFPQNTPEILYNRTRPAILIMNKTILFTFFLGLVLILCLTTADANADAKRRNNKSRNVERSEKRKSARRRNKNRKAMNQKKKGSSKNKGKKKQNNKRKQKKSRNLMKGSRSNCARQSAFCPSEKAQALNIYYNKMTNYFKQLKRAENWAKIVLKKKEKKDGFVNDALILEAAVGGDISAPVCTSSARSASASGATLKNCSTSIEDSCADITIDASVSGDCKTKMETFQTKVDDCKTSDDCTCWTEAFAMKSDLSSCEAKTEMDRVQGLKTSCLSKFSECKQAQDAAVELTVTCPASQTTMTTGAAMTTMAAKRRKLIANILHKNIIKRSV